MLWSTTTIRLLSSIQPSYKPFSPLFSTLKTSQSMENPPLSPSPSLLILHGKTSLESQFAQSLKSNKSLVIPEPDGELPILLHQDHPIPTTDSFNIDSYMNSLSTSQFGKFMIFSPILSSTQDLITKNFTQIPTGTVCIADTQFKGKGRSKNQWESPKGCLMFSFTLQMEDGRIVPMLQYVVCLAITESIKDVCVSKGFPILNVRIKWPNDLYLNGMKIGGILCNSTYSLKKFNVTVGMGLNVDNEMPTTCLNKVLRELSSIDYDHKITREEVLAAFFKRFEDFFEVFISRGFKELEGMYCRAWLHTEQRVVIQETGEDGVVEEIGVTIQGLTAAGYLLAVDDDNQMYELHPDGNSLDFFNGLVRRKL